MKKLIILTAACIAGACTNAARPVANTPLSSTPASNAERPQTAIAHSSENKAAMPPSASGGGGMSKWSQSGDAFDTTAFDSAIMAAEKALGAKPNDPAAKKALADAYLKRATELTAKRQYASALGDYRRTLKYDPNNAEAKDWIEQIISIYSSINRESPKEGEEPPPLPFTKGK